MDISSLLILQQQIDSLRSLVDKIKAAHSLQAKLNELNALPIVQEHVKHPHSILAFFENLSPESEYVIKSIIALGQGSIVFNMRGVEEDSQERLKQLLERLLEIEVFYRQIGGIIGYHFNVLNIILNQKKPQQPLFDHTHYIHPEGFNLKDCQKEAHEAIAWGIESLEYLAEMYPVGGAGDRLNLKDDKGTPLPAALLPFVGRTLLEGLIRDLQAREYLFFKLFGRQIITPVAMMTSIEKNNHIHILNICKKSQWFGRPSESFYFFIQPVVPVMTEEGNWSLNAPLTLNLKPSGHGVIWKLAEEQGVFDWLEKLGKSQCLIRQINNPLAGLDASLLALAGIGWRYHKAFGFVSCERLLNSAEGTNVLIETKTLQGYEYRITNIEYTDFVQRGIGEIPAHPDSPFSTYPTNTNILFADIPSIRNALKICSIPGQLINMKSKISYIDSEGNQSYLPGGRLESTMQNIADYLVDHFPKKLTKEGRKTALRTYIVYNERAKTISTTKQAYQPGQSPVGTPEQAYYDLLSSHYHLLKSCGFELPQWSSIGDFLLKGPNCIFLFHPALGPLHSIIVQKLRQGRLAKGAELQLEIAEADIENLDLEGSLLIEAVSPLGSFNKQGLLQFGQESRCFLHNVTIRNQGIDQESLQGYWQNDIKRKEAVRIVLQEGAEFHADGVTLVGNWLFEVPAYHRLILEPQPDGTWTQKMFEIDKSTWHWHYVLANHCMISLSKEGTSQQFTRKKHAEKRG